MLRILFYTCLLLWLCCTTAAQNSIKQIEQIKNDSLAIAAYEKYLASHTNSTKQLLDVKYRIFTRACVSHSFSKAITIGNEGVEISRINKLDSLEAAFTKMLGITYYFMGDRKRATQYFQKAIELAEAHNLWFIAATCYNNIGAINIDNGDLAKAETSLLKSIAVMEEHHMQEHESVAITYRLLATNYYQLKQPQKAEVIYKKLIADARAKNDTSMICGELIYYGKLLADRGDTAKALAMSGEALRYLRHSHVKSDLVNALSNHAKNLMAVGRYKEAMALQNEAYEIQKQKFLNDLEKQVSEVEVKYKTRQIEEEKRRAEENIQKQKWLYLLSFTILAVVAAFSIYIFNQRKDTRQKNELQKQRLQSIIEGEEKERTRIAKDLHDGIVQNLTAIKLKMHIAFQDNKHLPDLSKDIDQATGEVRGIAYQMMPIVLREFGLLKALEDLLQKSLAPKNIQFEFEPVNIHKRLPEKIEVCLYRITQELINNVVKHSKASFVSLVITKQTDFVSLIFEDNGTGFNTDEVKKGIGMTSLSSRLEIVNGELKFESSAGAGTMAIIKIPFQ